MKKTKFSWKLWYFTNHDEDLFTLTPAELYLFRLLCKEALEYR